MITIIEEKDPQDEADMDIYKCSKCLSEFALWINMAIDNIEIPDEGFKMSKFVEPRYCPYCGQSA